MYPQGCGGSSPFFGTIAFVILYLQAGDAHADTTREVLYAVNREGNLTKRIQTPASRRYCPVVLSGNGRVRPDLVVVNGREERHSEGVYYLEWRKGAHHPETTLRAA